MTDFSRDRMSENNDERTDDTYSESVIHPDDLLAGRAYPIKLHGRINGIATDDQERNCYVSVGDANNPRYKDQWLLVDNPAGIQIAVHSYFSRQRVVVLADYPATGGGLCRVARISAMRKMITFPPYHDKA